MRTKTFYVWVCINHTHWVLTATSSTKVYWEIRNTKEIHRKLIQSGFWKLRPDFPYTNHVCKQHKSLDVLAVLSIKKKIRIDWITVDWNKAAIGYLFRGFYIKDCPSWLVPVGGHGGSHLQMIKNKFVLGISNS